MDSDTLARHAAQIDRLLSIEALAPDEQLFLRSSELYQAQRRSSGRVVAGVTAVAAAALVFGAYAYHAQRMVFEASSAGERKELEALRVVVAKSRSKSPLDQAHDALARREYEAAVRLFTEAERTSMTLLTDLYHERGDALDRLARDAKSDADRRRQYQARSQEDFVKWLGLAPNAAHHLDVAELMVRNGDYKSAAEHVDRAARLAPSEPASSLITDRGLRLASTLQKQGAATQRQAAEWSRKFGNSRPITPAEKTKQ